MIMTCVWGALQCEQDLQSVKGLAWRLLELPLTSQRAVKLFQDFSKALQLLQFLKTFKSCIGIAISHMHHANTHTVHTQHLPTKAFQRTQPSIIVNGNNMCTVPSTHTETHTHSYAHSVFLAVVKLMRVLLNEQSWAMVRSFLWSSMCVQGCTVIKCHPSLLYDCVQVFPLSPITH